MSGELTLFILRIAFLAVLWMFIFSIIYALRSDLFGTRASEYQRSIEQSREQSRQQTFAAATPAAATEKPVVTVNRPVADGSDATGSPYVRQAATQPEPPAFGGDPEIVLTSGPLTGERIDLDGTLTIGRNPRSDLVLHDEYSSTNHARISRSGNEWMLQDLDSTNGTYVEGRRIHGSVPLRPGDSVRIGTTTFELRA